VTAEVHQGIREEATASADRVVREAQQLAWRELTWRGSAGRLAKYAFPDWRSSHTLRVISPGNCVALTWEGEATQTQCSGLETAGAPAPIWFEALHRHAFGPSQPVRRVLTLNRREAGAVVTTPDQGAVVRQVWRQVRVVLAAAAAMAACIALLATLAIGQALHPAAVITRRLRRLEQGDLTARLPRFRAAEFDRIARAVNDLGERLARTGAERASLTRRLFQVQEEERRALARDLHDEFGQCLTAAGALARAIEDGTGDSPDLREDARAISRITRQMMATLKGALARLRPPDLDELGLEPSLRRLVASWRSNGSGPAFRLDVTGDLAGVPRPVALNIYRIVQECLTNAVRHGRPTCVSVHLARSATAVALTVADDGGGDPSATDEGRSAAGPGIQERDRPGHGMLGIRERIGALGGTLAIENDAGGLRVAATIPCPLPATDAALPESPDGILSPAWPARAAA
jgi:signal transduction histidine kinase